MEHRDETITLRSTLYKEKNRILTVFSRNEGIITLFAKENTRYLSIFEPFTISSLVYRKKEDRRFLIDATSLDCQLHLRKSLELLQTSSMILKALIRSQMEQRQAPLIYQLFLVFLKNLNQDNLKTSYTSFLLKLLIHEGLIHLRPHCGQCDQEAFILYRGESLCSTHNVPGSHEFSKQDWDYLHILAFSRKLSEIEQVSTDTLFEPAKKIFDEMIR